MASSGQISGSTNYTGLAARLNWSQSANPASNSSDITLEMQIRNTTGSYFSYGASWTATLDGTAHSFSAAIAVSAEGSPWTTVWAKTYTVAHESDGTKSTSLQVAGSFTVGQYAGTVTIPNTTITLDTITARPASISSVTQAVGVDGTGSLAITISKPTGTQYCQAEIRLGNHSQSASLDSGTSYTYTIPASWADAIGSGGHLAGSVTVTTYTDQGHNHATGTATASFTAYRKCVISSVTGAVGVDGTGIVTVTLARTNCIRYGMLEIELGSHKETVSLDDGRTKVTYTIPASWADAIGNAGYLAGTVTVTSYTNSAHTAAIGSDGKSFTAYRKCTITSWSQSVRTGSSLTAVISKANATPYAQLVIALGSKTESVNMDSRTSYEYVIPRDWETELERSGLKTGTVTLTTYTAANHATAIGTDEKSFTASTICHIVSVSSPVDAGGVLKIAIRKPVAGMYAKATVSLGRYSEEIDLDSPTGDGLTGECLIDPTWASLFPSEKTMAGTVTLTTYTDSGYTTEVGSETAKWTCRADEGLSVPEGALWVEQGSWNGATGADTATNTRIRSGWLELGAGHYTVTNTSGLKTAYATWLTSGAFEADHDWGDSSITFDLDGPRKVRIVWKNAAGTAIAPGDLTGAEIWGGTKDLTLTAEQGSWDGSTGQDTAASTRVRSGYLTLTPGSYTVINASGFQTAYATWFMNGAFEADHDWTGEGVSVLRFELRETRKVRIVWKYDDETAITPQDLTGAVLTKQDTRKIYGKFAMVYPVSGNQTVNGWSVAVAGYSYARVRIDPEGVGRNLTGGFSVAGYKAEMNGESTAATQSGAYYYADLAILRTPGTQTGTVTVTSGRGNTATAVWKAQVYPYSGPGLGQPDAERTDGNGAASEDGAYIRVKADAIYSRIGGNNSYTLRARYKTAPSAWENWSGSWTALTSGTAALMGGSLSDQTAYTAQIQITDALGGHAEYEERIPTKRIMLHLKKNNRGMGIGGYAGADDWIESQFSIHTAGDLKMDGHLTFDQAGNIPYWNLEADGTEIAQGTDLNDLVTPGNYQCGVGATAQTLLHRPGSLAKGCIVKVYCSCGPTWWNWLIQEIVEYDGQTMWRRYIELYESGANQGTTKNAGSWYKYTGTAD